MFSRSALAAILSIAIVALPASASAAPGDRDRSFGRDGIVFHDFGRAVRIEAVAVQPDGRVVIAGTTVRRDPDNHTSRVLVARFRGDGTLDRGFADGGRAIFDLKGNRDFADGLVVRENGRIAVGVGTGSADRYGQYYSAGVLQLRPGGSLDRGFGVRGLRFLASGIPDDLALADDGDLVLAATQYFDDEDNSQTDVARLNPDGSPDDSFGERGFVDNAIGSDFDTDSPLAGLAVDGPVTYLATATDRFVESPARIEAAALDRSGEPVEGFGGGDCADAPACYTLAARRVDVSSLAVDGAGRLTIGASLGRAGSADALRLLPDGNVDTSFGEAGFSAGSPGAARVEVDAVLIESGRALLAGGGSLAYTRALTEDGMTDEGWGSGGYSRALARRGAKVKAAALAPGKLVLAGWALPGGRAKRPAAVLIRLRR